MSCPHIRFSLKRKSRLNVGTFYLDYSEKQYKIGYVSLAGTIFLSKWNPGHFYHTSKTLNSSKVLMEKDNVHVQFKERWSPDHTLYILVWAAAISQGSSATFWSQCTPPNPFYLEGQKLHYSQGKLHWPNLTGYFNSLRVFFLFVFYSLCLLYSFPSGLPLTEITRAGFHIVFIN